ncbi:MAG: substrate-binding domain-containing protein [Cyclobacteriaceae bacterium]
MSISYEELIDQYSKEPKYIQLEKVMMNLFGEGEFVPGEQLFSINEASAYFNLSRDTIEKAYKSLKEKEVIISVRGKGYFLSDNFSGAKIKVLVLLNKLSDYKKTIYQSLVETLGDKAIVNLAIFYYDQEILFNLLTENNKKYTHIVIMPHFKPSDQVNKLLSELPEGKLFFLDHRYLYLDKEYPTVFQDFKNDIYDTLRRNIGLLTPYKRIILIFPKNDIYPYPREIRIGISSFAEHYKFDFTLLEYYSSEETPLEKGDLFITMRDDDLISVIKEVREREFNYVKDIGIISYNETPLKEILENGITVVSTNFKKMGVTMAELILSNENKQVRNDFSLVPRNTL